MSDENNDDDLNFDFNTSDVKEEKDIGANKQLPPGFYHVEVEKVEKDHKSAQPCLKFTFTVLAGPKKRQKVFERLFMTEKNNGRVILFGNRLGLIAPSELGKSSVRKNWNDAVGKKVFIEVEHREYTAANGDKKTGVNLAYNGIHRLNDPAVPTNTPREDGSESAETAAATSAAATAAFDDI
jgi:hypothetical protein